jgi:serine/threonine-protein kinase
MPIPTPEERLGTTVAGKYRLDSIIGRGGAGVLYRAKHRWTGRDVALKMLHAERVSELSKAGRLLAEARASADLKHPNVVDVLDADIEDGSPFVVLELLAGRSLGEEVRLKGKLDPAVALRFTLPIIGAVATAHEKGILHRDIKLENIFLADEKGREPCVKLLDFGLARPIDAGSFLTESGGIVGTPAFMAPEQAQGLRDIGPQVDVWGLGVVLFASLAGSLPFKADSTTALLIEIVSTPAPRLCDVAPHVPKTLGQAVDRALQRDRSLRYALAQDFARALLSAAVRDGIALPDAPDPIGLASWPEWLADERRSNETESLGLSAVKGVASAVSTRDRRRRVAWGLFAVSLASIALWAITRASTPRAGAAPVELGAVVDAPVAAQPLVAAPPSAATTETTAQPAPVDLPKAAGAPRRARPPVPSRAASSAHERAEVREREEAPPPRPEHRDPMVIDPHFDPPARSGAPHR